MADEDITLDGKPLQSLRVADLKAALEQRSLPKSGQKNALVKRLKGALMLESLQKSSSTHIGLQPNSQIGEEMSQNSFIKQYLAKQQELLRQRLEREAQQAAETSESSEMPEDDDDHSESNESPAFIPDKHRPSQPPLTMAEEEGGGPAGLQPAPAPPPPRAVASLSVRVLGQPPAERAPSRKVRCPEESDEDSEDPSDEEEEEEEEGEDWGHGAKRRGRGGLAAPAQPSSTPPPPAGPSAAAVAAAPRSRRKLQPPQHIPPPAAPVHQPPLQLRHPTPPPSPPPELSFPLPDTPKQSPRDAGNDEPPAPERAGAAPRPQHPLPLPPAYRARRDSDTSSSRSSSPDPFFPDQQQHRRPGATGGGMLTLLARKIEAERGGPASAPLDMSGGGAAAAARAGCSGRTPLPRQQVATERSLEEESKRKHEEERGEKKREKMRLEEEEVKGKKQREEGEKRCKAEEAQKEKQRREEEKRSERKCQEEDKKRLEEKESKKEAEEKEVRKAGGERARSPKRSVLVRAPAGPPVATTLPTKRSRAFSDTLVGSNAPPAPPTKVQRASPEAVVTEAKESESSSDSDSGSSSSSRLSSSPPCPDKQLEKDGRAPTTDGEKMRDVERRYPDKREVTEPSPAAVTEVEQDSEGPAPQQPASKAEPDTSEGCLEESTTPKAFAARRISLTTGSKTSPASTDGGAGGSGGGAGGGCAAVGDADAGGGAAGRKRRWGSSTAVTTKKPSISITTDSLKSLIPDIKMGQEAVVELHPEELQLSGDEENQAACASDQDQGLRIRRTVTQVVAGDGHENGQNNEEDAEDEEQEVKKVKVKEEEANKAAKEKRRRSSRDKRKDSHSEETMETQISVKHETEAKKVTPSDSLVRRSISQQNAGVSVTLDDPVRTAKQATPPRGRVSNIVHVTNLVRPFTLGQLKELLNRTGSVLDEAFWIDKIKSHCYVTYATAEEAAATRTALHGVKWPQSNPKVLSVDFCEQDEVDFHKGLLKPDQAEDARAPPLAVPLPRLPPLMAERERVSVSVRDQWAEREREMQRRERARGEREWDRDKIREFGQPGEDGRRSRSRERRRRERAKSKERKTDKKEKADDPPPKLLDDLFLKTKAAPCIYWLPLTEEQVVQRVKDHAERQKQRERRRKEQEEEEEKKREEEKKERLKAREKEGGATSAAAVAVVTASGARGGGGGGVDGERGGPPRGRERGRDGEGDRRKDGYRPRGVSGSAGGGGRRSHSRSNPRERRR